MSPALQSKDTFISWRSQILAQLGMRLPKPASQYFPVVVCEHERRMTPRVDLKTVRLGRQVSACLSEPPFAEATAEAFKSSLS
jgi:hypothetical protein